METKAGLPVITFDDLAAWETWLATQAGDANGLWLKRAKAGNSASSLTKAEAIDGALCHGLLDGQIDKYDDAWFLTRFTPRKSQSKWSEKNRDRAEQLIAGGRMSPAGQAAIAAAEADGRWAAAYAPASTAAVPAALAAAESPSSSRCAPPARQSTDRGITAYAILTAARHNLRLPGGRRRPWITILVSSRSRLC